MKKRTPISQKTMRLDGAGADAIHVRPEAFAQLDLWISHSLEEIQNRWAHFSTNDSSVLRKRAQITNAALSAPPKHPK